MSIYTPLESAHWFAGLPKLALSANAVLRDDQGRVALVRNTYRDGWSLPGGVVDDNEPPTAACVRELAEELGYEMPQDRLGPLLAVQWAQRAGGSTLQFLSLTFDAGVCEQPDKLRPQPEEIAEIGFFALDALPAGTRPFIVRRLGAIGSRPGQVVYLEETLDRYPDAAA